MDSLAKELVARISLVLASASLCWTIMLLRNNLKCANNPSVAMQPVFAASTRDVDLRGLASPVLGVQELSGGGVQKPESLSVALGFPARDSCGDVRDCSGQPTQPACVSGDFRKAVSESPGILGERSAPVVR